MKAETVGRGLAILAVGLVAGVAATIAPVVAVGYVAYQIAKDDDGETEEGDDATSDAA